MLEAQSDQLQMWDGKNSKISVVFCPAPAVRPDRGLSTQPREHRRACRHSAQSIFGLSIFALAVAGANFIIVFTLLAYSVVKFRKRKNDGGRESPQVYGSNQVEVAWSVIPILIVVALFMATARVIADIQKTSPPANAIEVVAIGPQLLVGIARFPDCTSLLQTNGTWLLQTNGTCR
jgi:hypothetical protein